jgi:hypothetical protein
MEVQFLSRALKNSDESRSFLIARSRVRTWDLLRVKELLYR